MKNNILKKLFYIALPLFFWLFIWQISAVIANHSYILPTVPETVSALFKLTVTASFYKAIFSSLLRVMLGLLLGCVFGVLFAILSHKFKLIKSIILPMLSIFKSTPVASIIIILWVFIDGRVLPVFIAFMMVMPIIWQNVMNGFSSISSELEEVCRVFEFSTVKKIKILIFPALLKFFIPALITASGLAWKSEIAAEIIAYTKDSIGKYIYDAKSYDYDTPTVFAWTLVIILLSILIEQLTKLLLRRFKA